jgi:AcrR family transcriptional regulator
MAPERSELSDGAAGQRQGSLRERKREASRRKILRAAAVVFKRKGFDHARMEDIARRADVSPGTLYNYFPSKDGLLLALVSLYREAASEDCKAIVRDPPRDPATALIAFHNALLDNGVEYLSRALWRHVYSAIMLGAWHTPEDDQWRREWDLIAQARDMLAFLKTHGHLPTAVEEDHLARVAHAIVYFNWQAYMADESMSLSRFKTTIGGQIRMLLS